MSDYNDYDHALCILIEGVCQYFIHLHQQGDGMPPIANSSLIAAVVSSNIDLEWLFHFLFDYGFLYWDLRQSIRANDSKRIDLAWRECVSFMHTSEANKTQYAPMAILRIFWSSALSPKLAQVYHNNRTISLLGLRGSNVGWDMPIEKENLAISTNVTRPNYDRINKYIAELNFTGPVSRGVERMLFANRQMNPSKKAKIKDDVKSLKDYLIQELGNNWQSASVPRDQSRSKLVNPARSPKPWESTARAINDGSFDKWVRSHLDSKVTWM